MIAEKRRVKYHRVRAEKLGKTATLTIREWEQTIRDFNGYCAYCLVRPFTLLEHYLPVEIAGTHAGNCIPACQYCNIKKSNRTGKTLEKLFGGATIRRIERYLATRQSSNRITESHVDIPDEKVGERYYMAEEAMKILKKSRSAFYREVEDGTIPSELEEGRQRGRKYPKEAIDAHARIKPKNRGKYTN